MVEPRHPFQRRQFERLGRFPRHAPDTPAGKQVFGPIQTDYLLNFKDSHVTVVTFLLDSWKFNDPKEKPADYVPNILAEIAAGRR